VGITIVLHSNGSSVDFGFVQTPTPLPKRSYAVDIVGIEKALRLPISKSIVTSERFTKRNNENLRANFEDLLNYELIHHAVKRHKMP